MKIRIFLYVSLMSLVLGLFAPDAALAAATTSRQSPLALGKTADVGDYTVRVKSVNLDAAQAVANGHPYNAPPTEGNVFVLVEIEVTYTGSGTGNPAIDLSFKSVGDKNRGYDDLNSSCGVVPHSATEAGELFENGTASFNKCWQVSAAEAPTLIMYAEPLFSLDKSQRVWFALSDPNATPSPVPTADPNAFVIDAQDIVFAPKSLTIPANTAVTITITNKGLLQHDFNIDELGVKSKLLNGGESTTVTINAAPGTYQYYCSVPGHKEAGMIGTLIVQ